MTAQVTLTLSDTLYERVRNLAQRYKRGLSETITEHLDKTLEQPEIAQKANSTHTQRIEMLDQEEAAYIKLHTQLKSTHLGRYVAVYQGQLFDSDEEMSPMIRRVRSKLPNQVVWMTKVQNEPIQTIVRRENRLLPRGE